MPKWANLRIAGLDVVVEPLLEPQPSAQKSADFCGCAFERPSLMRKNPESESRFFPKAGMSARSAGKDKQQTGQKNGGYAKGAEKLSSSGETVVQNAKMGSKVFSTNSEVFKCSKSNP